MDFCEWMDLAPKQKELFQDYLLVRTRLALAEGMDPNENWWIGGSEFLGRERYASLHFAAAIGHLEMCRVLLDAGAEVDKHVEHEDAEGEKSKTALHYAALHGRVDVCRLLLEAGADPNACDCMGGYVPLHYAAGEGNVAICTLLLEHGAEVDAACWDEGLSPLQLAQMSQKWRTVRVLMEAGADAYRENFAGSSAASESSEVRQMVAELAAAKRQERLDEGLPAAAAGEVTASRL